MIKEVLIVARMKDIADSLGISINAVSLALNNKKGVSEDTRFKVLKAAAEMKYIDKNRKYAQTYTACNLCVMMQRIYSDDMNFYGKVLFSCVEHSKRSGYDVLINFFNDDNMELPGYVTDKRVAGILVIGKISDVNIKALKELEIPLVIIDHASMLMAADCVITDNKMGGYIAAKYLIEKGFNKIGFFGDLSYSLSIKERFFGFNEALAEFMGLTNHKKRDEYISAYSLTADIEPAVLKVDMEYIVHLLQNAENIPEAFVCSNDKAAILLIRALRSLGYKLPRDISVLGFDNIDMCEQITPALTTVNVNKDIMGKRAMQRLKHLIYNKNSKPENITLNVKLIERDSVRK